MKKMMVLLLLLLLAGMLSIIVVSGMSMQHQTQSVTLMENNCVYSGTGDDFDHYGLINLDLGEVRDADLVFWTKYTIVEPNQGYIEVSTDDKHTWEVLESFSGYQYDWEQVIIDLDTYVGEEIWLAFHYKSTDEVVDLGWYIDSVIVDSHWTCLYYNDFEQYESYDAWWNFTVLEKPGPPPMILNQFFDNDNNIYFFNTTITDNHDFTKSWDQVFYTRTAVPNENTYVSTHSYGNKDTHFDITMWTTLSKGSITPFNVYTLSSSTPYGFCEFACPMDTFCTIDDVSVTLQDSMITARVHTTSEIPWWGCFTLHPSDEIVEITAMSETEEFDLVNDEDFSINDAESVRIIAVQMKPVYDQVQVVFETNGGNQAPDSPDIFGPVNGTIDQEYEYTLSSVDPDGDEVQFFVDWGDGSITSWTPFVNTGEEIIVNHTWEKKGSYLIKAKARDVYGVESTWATFEVQLPKKECVNIDDQSMGFTKNCCCSSQIFGTLGLLDGEWTFNETTKTWCILFSDIYVNSSLLWSTEIIDAYQAFFRYKTSYDFGPYAAGFVELSKDDGNTWYLLDVLTGNATNTVREFDISHAAGNEILIRFRAKSGEDDLFSAGKWCIWDLSIYGMKDRVPPVSTVILNGNQTESGWYHSPVEVVISAVDPTGVGIKELHYILDGDHVVLVDDTVSFTVSSTGEYTIEYWAVDRADNEETPHQISFKIDLLPPTLMVDDFMPGVYLFGNKIFSAQKTIFIGSFTITGMVTDAESGVDMVRFFLDESLFAETTQSSFSVSCAESHSGYAVLKIMATDQAGNTKSDLQSFHYFMI